MTLYQMFILDHGLLFKALLTIASPVFCEFVIELCEPPCCFGRTPSERWARWEEIDKLFDERCTKYGDFKVIIRTGKLCDPEAFQRNATGSFPSLARRESLQVEMSHG